MAYSEKVIDHYENPRNVGSFDNNDENVGSGMVGAPACGDVMKLQIKVNDEDDEDMMSQPRTYEEAMDKRTPMTYEQFPKNYDSSNSMMMMQGGMGGMMMPGMF